MYIALRASLRAIVTGLLYFREFYRSSSIQKVMKQGRVYEVDGFEKKGDERRRVQLEG